MFYINCVNICYMMSICVLLSFCFFYKFDWFKLLCVFCQIVCFGLVLWVVEVLFVSQLVISLQLQVLEWELGVLLFECSGCCLVFSCEGQLLYEMVQLLVENLDGLEVCFCDKVCGLDVGELNIVVNSLIILYLLLKIVECFCLYYLDVCLILYNVISVDGIDLLCEDVVDLVIGLMIDVLVDFSYVLVYCFEQVLIVLYDYLLVSGVELELVDIVCYLLVLLLKWQIIYWLVDQVFQCYCIVYIVVLEVGGWEVIKQYVVMGMGIFIVLVLCLNEVDYEWLVV